MRVTLPLGNKASATRQNLTVFYRQGSTDPT